jgi:hypothetical protein
MSPTRRHALVAAPDLQLTTLPAARAGIYQFSIDDTMVTFDALTADALELAGGRLLPGGDRHDLGIWRGRAARARPEREVDRCRSRDANRYQFHETTFVAVLAYDGQQLTVDRVRITMDTKPSGPKNLEATGEIPGTEQLTGITVNWDPAAGAEGYYIEYRPVVDPIGEYEFLAEVGSGTQEFTHTADSPAGKGAEYGVRYEYMVRSMFEGGPSQLGGPTVQGVRAIPSPEQFEASDQLDPQWVHLEWTPVEGAIGYAVRADDPENGPVGITTDTFIAWNTEDGVSIRST